MEDDIFSKPVEKNVPERHEEPKRSSKKDVITYPKEAVSPTLKWLIVLACALAVGLFIVAYFQAVNDWMDQEDNLATQTTHKVTPTPTVEATITPTGTITSTPTTSAKAGWKTYTNNNYIIQYPKNYGASNIGMGSLDINSGEVSISKSKQSDLRIHTYSSQGSIKSFANTIWQANNNAKKRPELNNQIVTPLKTITVNNQQGYSFNLSTSYSDSYGGYLLDDGQYTVTILGKSGKFVVALYLASEETTYQSIFDTIQIQ